jgi:rhamnogalacturonan endolyase
MFRYFRKHQGPKQETSFRKRRKSSLSSHSRDGHHAQYGRLKFETLEPRWVLSSVSGVDNTLYYASLVSNPTTGAITGATVTASAPRQMEYLDRGVVAINEGGGTVYVGWRLLGTDPSNIAFNLYRSTSGGAAVKINSSPLTVTTDYVNTGVNTALSNSYFVKPVIGGVEQAPSETFTLPASAPVQQYLSIPLQIPAGGTIDLTGESYTYSANDCSVGDLDGDGQYEIIVKWDPSNSKDNAQDGYTGNVYLDAYKLDGTRLWRIDLGKNIRAGAHYTQFMVYDLDGDGRAEVAMKTAPGTIDGEGHYVLMGNDNPNADYRTKTGRVGRILDGPEYLTIFNGMTGAAMATTNYVPARGSVSSWGDSYGNRVDRFLAAVAYLDDTGRPSLVMCRGYYTRAVLAAWDWRDGHLTQKWIFDTNTAGYSGYTGQGDHSLSVADVDGDGKDEIIYGACAIDDNGTGLYTTGLGHGDAMHVGDLDPTRPGLEVFEVHETPSATAGAEMHDAATGALLWGIPSTADVGRGVSDDIYAGTYGAESWASNTNGLYDRYGNYVGRAPSSTNFLVWWDADHVRELLDSNHIDKYGLSSDTRLLTATGSSSNNGTKSTPCLSADLFGDWREEVIWRTDDSQYLRIYTTTIPATDRIYTLMHDTQYRESIAWQNVAYNQPPHTSFYLGDGMAAPPTPNIYLVQSILNPPSVPTNIAATVITPSRIDVTWTASQGATLYRIKRAYSAGGPYITIGFATTGTSFSDTNVEVSGVYYYIVTAISNSGESANSPVIIGSVTGLPAPTNLTATAVSSSQVNLSWTASAGATSYLVRRSFNSGGPYTTIASGVTSTSYSDTTVTSGGTYYYTIAAVSATNGSANAAEVSVSITLPAPWIAQDIGNVGITGHTTYSNSVFQVTGSTASSGDGFQFVTQGFIGDSTLIAKVDSQSANTGWGGLMIRKSAAADSAYARIVATSDSKNHLFFYYRTSDGGTESYGYAYAAVPVWLKLTRTGNQFAGFYSTDNGVTWTQVGSTRTINMNTLTLGGLAVCSNSTSILATTQFSNVSITSANTAPTVTTAASASPNPATGTLTTNLSILGADDGGESNLTYTWASTGTPPAPVTFSANGNNAAKNTVATFTKAGTYNFQVSIMDSGGLNITSSVSVIVYSSIAGRNIFYNNSRYDGHTGFISGDPAINIYDDNAIATDKQALLPGHTATFANYTSFSRGINGIMVDVQHLANPVGITAADFQFKVGNGSAWTAAPAPNNVLVRQGAGTGGSDRVTITWDDNVIQNQWLQVTVLADANTGLAAPDVFYFGNAIGESGDNPANALVDFQDELASRTHKSGIPIAPITSPYDYNRDGRVNATDDIIARHNRTDGTGGNPLQLISAPVGSPPAAGDALQPLSLPADVATMQPLTSQADVVTMQPVLLLAAAIVPVQAASAPVESPLANQVAYVSGGSEHSRDLLTVKSASAVDNVVRDPSFAMLPDVLQRLGVLPRQETALLSVTIRPTITEDFSTLSPWRNDAAHNNPTSRQDSLHDAFFTHSIVQHLLTEDGLPADSSAPADIETLINDCLPGKNNKSLAHAIDTVLSAARRKKE